MDVSSARTDSSADGALALRRDRAKRLFTYLAERTRLRAGRVQDIRGNKRYPEVLWLDDLPDVPQVYSAHRAEPKEPDPEEPEEVQEKGDVPEVAEDAVLVSVERPKLPEAPVPPKEVGAWLRGGEKAVARWDLEPPTLLEFILEPTAVQREGQTILEDRKVLLAERPHLATAWEEYLEKRWKPWASERARVEPHRKSYARLFELRTQVEREGEDFELVICSGLLCWMLGREAVYRHVATQAVRIELDVKSGRISVFPASAASYTRLESEMLPTARQPKTEGLDQVERVPTGDLMLAVPSTVSRVEVMSTLAGWAHRLDADCVVSPNSKAPRSPTENQPPSLTFAPALILRKRPAISMTVAFEQCAAQMGDAEEIPFNVTRVVEVVGDRATGPGQGERGEAAKRQAASPLFPLPFNDEQVRVAQRLKGQHGVLVQGPPGTGKTLTIANLICHLLAEGKRILVTSAKARPLTVLYDKLPDQLKPLCLTSLGGGREETERLRASVQGILDRHSSFDLFQSMLDEERLGALLDQLAEEKARLMNQRRDRWELEARRDHKVADGRYSGQPMEIAEQVAQHATQFGWFPDELDRDDGYPLNQQQLTQIEALLRDVSIELRTECAKWLPDLATLIPPAELEAILLERSSLAKRVEDVGAEIERVRERMKAEQESALQVLKADVEAAQASLKAAQGDLSVATAKAARERARIEAKKAAIDAEHGRVVREFSEKYLDRIAKGERDVNAARRVVESIQGLPGRTGQVVATLSELGRSDLSDLSGVLKELMSLLTGVRGIAGKQGVANSVGSRPGSLSGNWRSACIRDVMVGRIDQWARLFDQTSRHLNALPPVERMEHLSRLRFELPPDVDAAQLLEDARDLNEHFKRGGGKGLPFFRKRPVKQGAYIFKSAFVNGAACNNAERIAELTEFLDAEDHLRKAVASWHGVGVRTSLFDIDNDPLEQTAERVRSDLLAPLTRILELAPQVQTQLRGLVIEPDALVAIHQAVDAIIEHKAVTKSLRDTRQDHDDGLRPLIAQRDERIGAAEREWVPPDESAVRNARAELEHLQRQTVLQRAAIEDEFERELSPLREAAQAINDRVTQLGQRIDDVRSNLLDASRNDNAHPGCGEMLRAISNDDPTGYRAAFEGLAKAKEALPRFQAGNSALERLARAAPRLGSMLRAAVLDDQWRERLSTIRDAWAWAQAKSWVRHFRSLVDSHLDERIAEADAKSAQALAERASIMAWRHCLEAATEEQKRALTAWQQAMRRFGQGKGKYAEKHRRDATKQMRVAQGMIPALVTPLARLVESLPAKPKMFDVVVVDEASQLGPEGLLLFYIAEKVVVVGDDQQISPEDIGEDLRELQALVKRHIADIPQAERFEQESVFNLANMLFSDGRIMLREHFRCMPEIIKFSNELCYRDESGRPQLVPLRKFSGKRLEPVLRPVFVAGGNRSGDTNKPEIDAIVGAISQCIASPEYAKKTFGVVSLLGTQQADAIQRALIQSLGAEEVEERRIISGNAYAFQGDERDVMFMSLVVASGERNITALTKEADKRRFNVAASRARDQMWLFHSVQLDDLKPDDLRYKLLLHCKMPPDEQDYSLDAELKKCQSKFEREVAHRIAGRGLRVFAQVKIAGYSIDLVVEGADGKQLAVECDGDHWHGPERFDADMKRQRVLERCGWKFWRVWGSEFYEGPETALRSLWALLDAQEIRASSP